MNTTLRNIDVTRDSDAERGLLCTICHDPANFAEAVEARVAEDWFTVPIHFQMWEVMLKLDNKGSNTLDMDVMLAFPHGDTRRDGIMSVVESCDTGAHFPMFLKRVRDCWRRRKILKTARVLAEAAESQDYDSADEVLEIADKEVTAMTVEDTVTMETGAVVIEKAWENIQQRMLKGGMDGIPTGLQRLDAMTCGWRPGDVILVAARTSVGKTAFSVELALAGLKAGKRVLYFSLEMTNDQVMERMLANTSGVPIRVIVDKTLTDVQQKNVFDARTWLKGAPLLMDDDGMLTTPQIRAKARKVARQGLDMIVVDYAQLIRPDDPRASREQQVATVSKGIKALAKELRVPIVMLAQLRRSADEMNRRPRLSDLRESGALEQDADIVLMLWRKNDEPGQSVISIAKQRQGRTGDVEVVFTPSTQKFKPKPLMT